MINSSRSMSTIAAALAFSIAFNLSARLQPRENVALLERPTISYLTNSLEGGGIHLIDSDGQNNRLWIAGVFGLAPSWSLDGRRVSMVELSRIYDLYVFDIETQQMTLVSELINENRNEDQQIIITGAWWFPDGKKLACRASVVHQLHKEIYVLDVDTLEIKNKTRTPDISEGWASVSPDGRKIVCSGWGEEGLSTEIYVMSSTGADRINITNSPANERYPAWSPDGNWIAFEAAFRDDQEEDSLDIFIMRPDGSDVRKLTSRADGRLKNLPNWSRDSKWVVFTIRNEEGFALRDIYRVNIETGEKFQITHDGHPKAGTATWVLTGRRVLSVDPAGKKKEPWGALKLLLNDESAADE